jgi:hypothetical protein
MMYLTKCAAAAMHPLSTPLRELKEVDIRFLRASHLIIPVPSSARIYSANREPMYGKSLKIQKSGRAGRSN